MDHNWKRIAEAIEWYKALGFVYVETPWIVSEEAAMVTCPDHQYLDRLENGGVLAGSAEQGFIQMALDGKLDGINYVSAGPCFRTTDAAENSDCLHRPYFLKVELFVRCQSQDSATKVSHELVHRARNFLGSQMSAHMTVAGTAEGYDLEIHNIEVGSFGIRYHPQIGWWAYGTGYATPRTEIANNVGII